MLPLVGGWPDGDTDASFFRRGGVKRLYLGIYVLDPLSGEEVSSYLEVPQAFYSRFAPRKKTYIIQGELLAAVAALYTCPDLLAGRAVYMFIDNTAALSAIVHGYARKPDCAPMVNAFHEQVKSLRCFPWAEWVPSAANIADWASRPDLHWRVPASSSWRTMVLPPLDVFLGDV